MDGMLLSLPPCPSMKACDGRYFQRGSEHIKRETPRRNDRHQRREMDNDERLFILIGR